MDKEPVAPVATAGPHAWNCYLLITADGLKPAKTYIGITPDLDRRLAQHNGQRAGGARATAGRQWRRAAFVRGFPDHTAALQFEWRWKQITRVRFGSGGAPLERRLRALQELLALDRPTTAAQPYADYPAPLEVIIEAETEVPAL